jgi:hypothetical protein
VELTAAFPPALAGDVRIVQARLVPFEAERVLPLVPSVLLSTGTVTLPSRLYFQPPTSHDLSPTQRLILDCLYTRHHDGFLRQAHVDRVIVGGTEWCLPFVWTLLGEYVVEIVQQIGARLATIDTQAYAALLSRNPELVRLTRVRATSYWNAYFRHRAFPRFTDYPAAAIFARFGVGG